MTEITPSNQTPFYTPAGLARKLSLSERTLRSMLERGTIPSYKIGGSRRIDPTRRRGLPQAAAEQRGRVGEQRRIPANPALFLQEGQAGMARLGEQMQRRRELMVRFWLRGGPALRVLWGATR